MKIGSRLLVLFLVISIIPVTAFGIVTAINVEQEITRNVLRGLDALATIQESRVQGVLDQNLERLVTFTSRLQLKISIDDYIRTGDPVSQVLASRILQSALATGLYPFVLPDLIKLAIAAGFVPALWRVVGRTDDRHESDRPAQAR